MRRLLLTFGFFVLFAGLLWQALPDMRSADSVRPDSTISARDVAPATQPATAFDLRMSQRLSTLPTRAPSRATPTPAPSWWQSSAAQRTALTLLAASLLGLALGALWRSPVPIDDVEVQVDATDMARRSALLEQPERGGDHDAANDQIASLRQQWAAEQDTLTERNLWLENELDSRVRECAKLNGDLESLNVEVSASHAQLDESQQRLRALEDDLVHSRDGQGERQQAFDAQLAQLETDHIAALDALQDQHQAQQRDAQEEFDSHADALRQQIAQHEESLATAQAELLNANQTIDAAGEQSEHWQAQLTTLETTLAERDQRIDELEGATQALAQLREKHTHLTEQFAELEAAWQSLHTEQQALHGELDVTTAQLATSQEQCAAIASRLAERESSVHQLDTAQAALQDKLTAITSERDELKQAVDTSSHELGEQRGLIQSLEMGLETAAQRETELVNRGTEQHQRNEKLFAELDELVERHESALAEHDLLNAQHEALTTRLDQVNDQLRAANAALDQSHARIIQLEADNVELEGIRQTLAQWQSSVDSYREDIRRKNEHIDALDARSEQWEADQLALQAQSDVVADLEVKLTEQTRLARILKDGADSMRLYKAQTDDLKHVITELERDLATERETNAQQVAALRAQQDDAARLHETIDETQAWVDQTKITADQRQAQIEQLERDLAERIDELADTRRALSTERHERAQLRDDLDDFIALTHDIEEQLTVPIDEPIPTEPLDLEQCQSKALDTLREALVRFEALDDDVTETTRFLLMAESQAISFASDLDTLRPQFEQASAALAKSEMQCNELRDTVELQTLELREAESLREDLAALFEERERLAEQVRTLDAQYAQQTAQLDQLTDARLALEANHTNAEQQRDELAGQVSDLSIELARSEQLHAAAQQQADEAVQREHETLSELSRLQTDYNALQVDDDTSRQSEDRLTDDLETVRQHAHDVESQLAQAQQERAQFLHDLEEAQKEVAARASELTSAQAEHAQLSGEMAALEDQLTQTREALDHLDNEYGELQKTLSEVQQNAAESQLAGATLAQSEQATQAMRNQVQELQQQVDEREDALHQLVSAIDNLGHTDIEATTSLERLAIFQRQLQTKDGRIDELAHANLALRDAMREVRSDADATVQRLRAKIERAEHTAQKLTADIESAHAQQRNSRELDSQIDELTSRLAGRENDIAALRTLLTDYEQKLSATAPAVARKPVDVPVLTRSVTAPPVLTQAVRRPKTDD